MRERLRPALLALVVLAPLTVLAGCGHSPSTTLLTLAATPPPQTTRIDYRGPPVAIPAIHLPAELDRAEYVDHVSPDQIRVDDFARWIAPLGTLARDTLVRDLMARLPAGTVLPPGAAGGAGSRTIDVTILSVHAGASEAVMQAAYREVPNGVVRQVEMRTPILAPGQPVQNAEAFSELVGQLADRIAEQLPQPRP